MTERTTMSAAIDFFNLCFAGSRAEYGLDDGSERQARFDKLVEAAWDLGVLGVGNTEFLETIEEHGFDASTQMGIDVAYMVDDMYERSLELHGKTKGE
jgi:hypothetical protein